MLPLKKAVLTEVAVTATYPLVITVSTMRQAPNHQPVVLSDGLIARSTFSPTS